MGFCSATRTQVRPVPPPISDPDRLRRLNALLEEALALPVADFGVGKLLQGDADREGSAPHLTQVIGGAMTPDHASREQIAGKPVTVATDVYSLGVVLYELLSGQRPYRLGRQSTAALEEAILAADLPPASSRCTDRARAAQARSWAAGAPAPLTPTTPQQ